MLKNFRLIIFFLKHDPFKLNVIADILGCILPIWSLPFSLLSYLMGVIIILIVPVFFLLIWRLRIAFILYSFSGHHKNFHFIIFNIDFTF